MSTLGRAMGNQRARKKNDFYPTIDRRAIPPLLAHLAPGTRYIEPCAGHGHLIHLLDEAGLQCEWGMELEPFDPCLGNVWPVARGNALTISVADLGEADCFISNPPWSRPLLHKLITHLAALLPTWFLFDAAWMQTRQAARLAPICTDVVAVGRLKFFAESRHDPPDDCAWCCFDARAAPATTRYHWRSVPVSERDDGQGVLI